MGRKSTKKNKNIYQLAREARGLSRQKASDLLEGVSASTIEKIENKGQIPTPDVALLMSEKYGDPYIRRHYCLHECEIGQKHFPQVETKELPAIVLEILASLDAMEEQKKRFVAISVDGKVEKEEKIDFADIVNQLKQISAAVEAMNLWIEERVAAGEIDVEVMKMVSN